MTERLGGLSQVEGRNVTLLAQATPGTYPYVPPRSPSLDDFNALQWLSVDIRLSLMHGIIYARDRLYDEGKLGRGGSMNVINNQKCRCVNTRAGIYMIEKMRQERVVVNPGSIAGVQYYVMVEACEYMTLDRSVTDRHRAWDAHTIAVLSIYRGVTARPSLSLEYDFWISGAPKVYPAGRGMSSSHRGKVRDDMYSRSMFGSQAAFDENGCDSLW